MNRRAALIFVALGVAWGIPYLLIKVAVAELPPVTLVAVRTTLAALVLLPMALYRGAVRPVLQRWRPLLAYTVVEICVPWLFLNRAELSLPSSTTGLLISAVPLVGVLLSLAVAALTGERRDRLGLSGAAGLLCGTAGVAALVGLDVGGSSLSAVAEIGIVVVGYALGPVILVRYLSDLPGVGVVAVSLGLAAAIYLPVMLLGPGMPTVPSGAVIGSMAGLALLCTAAAFLLLFALVNEIGPVRATTITYLNPAVAIAAGVLVLDEPVTVWTCVGFALVLAGSFLVNRRPVDPPTAAPAETAAGRRGEPATSPPAQVDPVPATGLR